MPMQSDKMEKVTQSLEEETRRAERKLKARGLIVPTDEEDAAITRAAQSDQDNPPVTGEEMVNFKPARRGRGRPAQDVTKVPTSIRFDSVVLDSFKALGSGWQTHMNEVLRQYLVDTHQLQYRFHATVQARGNKLKKIDEFVVLARDADQAKAKVKQHLRAAGREDDARGQVHAVDVGNAIMLELPLIQ